MRMTCRVRYAWVLVDGVIGVMGVIAVHPMAVLPGDQGTRGAGRRSIMPRSYHDPGDPDHS